ncbi:hypothetical protein ABZ835_44535 [Streptomyces sp. NPDC047461]|uniref:hypothetical protein n=1 Tax=Streptomyces sp. NPDC047461 TaxID=3155619 RepID=UPI0033F78EF8
MSDDQPVAMLVERARSEGLQLTGQGGLLQQLTKSRLWRRNLASPRLSSTVR